MLKNWKSEKGSVLPRRFLFVGKYPLFETPKCDMIKNKNCLIWLKQQYQFTKRNKRRECIWKKIKNHWQRERRRKRLSPRTLSSEIDKDLAEAFTIMSRRDFLRNRTDIFILDTLNRLFWTLDWQKNTTENSISVWWHQPDEGEDGVCWVDHRGCKMAGRWFWGPPVFCIQLFPADVWVCSSSY